MFNRIFTPLRIIYLLKAKVAITMAFCYIRGMVRLFWCDIHYACFGIEATDGIITLTAPIVGWMNDKTLVEVKPWLKSRKAVVVEIKNPGS